MAILINNPNDRGSGATGIQNKITATTAALAATVGGTAQNLNLTKLLATQQMELVLTLLSIGRIDPAVVLSTLS